MLNLVTIEYIKAKDEYQATCQLCDCTVFDRRKGEAELTLYLHLRGDHTEAERGPIDAAEAKQMMG